MILGELRMVKGHSIFIFFWHLLRRWLPTRTNLAKRGIGNCLQ